MSDILLLLGIGLAVISVYMLVTWLAARRMDNYGLVDVAWAFGFILLVLVYSLVRNPDGTSDYLLGGMFVLSSARLAWHLTARFIRSLPVEDRRYTKLRRDLGSNSEIKMLGIFLWQGTILTLLTAPIAVAFSHPDATLDGVKLVASALWLVSFIGEAVADHQLTNFVKDKSNHGKTCQVGLWKYSRHPNYFFEWLSSVAFAMYVTTAPLGLFVWVCPLVLLHLLLNVTGVKPSEEHSMKTRPDYVEYAKTTSPFVPWFRRKLS